MRYYAGALALVQPALREGFGLPMLEAMAAGCPVVACAGCGAECARRGGADVSRARDAMALRVHARAARRRRRGSARAIGQLQAQRSRGSSRGIAARGRPPTSIERCWRKRETGSWRCSRCCCWGRSRSRSRSSSTATRCRSIRRPRFEGSLLFVPVRRTIEALGAAVRPDRQAHRNADRREDGRRSRSAAAWLQIDGQDVTLVAPPLEIKDVLYVPLRFFTDVLGRTGALRPTDQLGDDRRAARRRSASGFVTVNNGFRAVRYGRGGRRAIGSADDNAAVSTAASRRFRIAPNATIDVQDVNVNVTSPGELVDMRPGDFARVRDAQGRARPAHRRRVRLAQRAHRRDRTQSVRAGRRSGHRPGPHDRDLAQRQGRFVRAICVPTTR